jgi:hypothetical protein
MSRKSKVKQMVNSSIPSDFDDFVAWSLKKKFGIDHAVKEMQETVGPEGEAISRKLFEVSQSYVNFRFPDHAYILQIAFYLMEADCVESFFNVPTRIQPDIIEIARIRGHFNLKGYIETLRLAGYPKPCIMAGHITLKKLMLATLDLAGRDTAAKISNEFKGAVHSFASDRSSSRFITSTSLFVLYTVYGEKDILDIIKRAQKEDVDLTVFEIASLLKDWESFKHHPLSWTASIAVGPTSNKEDIC